MSPPATVLLPRALIAIEPLDDALFHSLGQSLLIGSGALEPAWTGMYNTPVLALTNFNNTVVLGSFLVWCAAAVPLYFAARVGVVKYRAHIYERLEKTKLFKAVKASKIYKFYTLLRPEVQ